MIDIFIIRIHEKKYISEWMSGANIYRNLHSNQRSEYVKKGNHIINYCNDCICRI